MLRAAGLELIHLGDFDDPDRPADETTWNVLGAARRPDRA